MTRTAADGFPASPIPPAGPAAARSPLRYPGGKTWLVPHVRAWLGALAEAPRLLIEPFLGGGVVSLTAVTEGLAGRALMAETDPGVAAFWRAALRPGGGLRELALGFEPTREAVEALAASAPDGDLGRGFRTLVLNRTRRGGVLAPGASLMRRGERGKGVGSRWYPETIARRLDAIAACAGRLEFRETDGMRLLEDEAGAPGTAVFADPPYTAGGKRAGARLYARHGIDHARLFALLDDSGAEFLMTCELAPETAALVRRHGFHAVAAAMRTGHHARTRELAITRRPAFPA